MTLKADALLRGDVPLSLVDKNPRNPNRMSSREFDLLVDNMQLVGWTDPMLLRPKDLLKFDGLRETHFGKPGWLDALIEADCRFELVGGHHRFDAGVYIGYDRGPATVIVDPAFDEERANFQLIRHNVIKGHLDPQEFVKLYAQYAGQYEDAILQEMFGFAEETDFKKLIATTAKQLPKELQSKFKEAAAEVKTIDELAKLLNRMFTMYGDSLPFGYLVVDHGGQDSLWLRCSKKTFDACMVIGDVCRENARTMDDIVGRVLQLIAKGELKEVVEKAIADTPAVVIPTGLQAKPTMDNIQAVAALD